MGKWLVRGGEVAVAGVGARCADGLELRLARAALSARLAPVAQERRGS